MAIKAGSTIGNIVWFLFGGGLMALSYAIAGILNCITIIGIPNGIQSFKLTKFALWPFGKDVKESESASGCISTIGNLIWILLGGWWLALSHVLWGVLLYIPIVTIPFGRQHFEMAPLALLPFGKKIVGEGLSPEVEK